MGKKPEPCVFCGDRTQRLEARIRDLERNIRESNIARARDTQHIEEICNDRDALRDALKAMNTRPNKMRLTVEEMADCGLLSELDD